MSANRPHDSLARSASRSALLVLVVAAMLAPVSTAHAIVLERSVPQLAAASSSVVVARVVSVVGREAPASGGALRGPIVSDVDLAVERALKGSPPDRITLTVPGGAVGGTRLDVSESPRFAVGERCIVFLDASGKVVGGTQGRLVVVGSDVPGLGLSVDQVAAVVTGSPMPVAPRVGAQATLSGAAPVITAIDPSRQSAGTGSSVTISGGGFGAAKGAVTFPVAGSIRAAATVTSWSDARIVCVVPAEASSGLVTVSGSTGSVSADYAVGFAVLGARWPSPSMTYRIWPNCADLTSSAAVGAVMGGAQDWDGASAFQFVYGGALGSSADAASGNGKNDVWWSTDGLTGVLAYTENWYVLTSSGGRLVESDLVFNDSYRWFVGSSISGFDVATIATHELGHALGLDDQYGAADATKVMYGMASAGELRTTLSTYDVAGARYIYGDPAGSGGTSTVPVYRFYNRLTGTHFYTASETEKNNVLATAWSTFAYEGVAYRAYGAAASGAVPLYRFYNRLTGTHFYTASETEKNNVIATLSGVYAYEGTAYWVLSAPSTGRAVFRFYNMRSGTHFYTASDSERDSVISTLGSIYKYEGPAFLVPQ